MQGKTHMGIGAAVALLISRKQPGIDTTAMMTIGAAVGALIPDLDHDKSKISNLLPVKNKLFKKLCYVLIGAILVSVGYSYKLRYMYFGALYIALLGFAHHRGFTHSLLALGIISIAVLSLRDHNLWFYNGLVIGYVSHLISDMFTKRGIELFFPCKKNIRFIITMTTGGKIEAVLNYAVTILIVFLVSRYI